MINLKKLFSATNLFYFGATVSIVVTIAVMVLVYSDQAAKNLQANLILSNADEIASDIQAQDKLIENLSADYFKDLPVHLNSVLSESFNTNEFTRYLDNLELDYKQNGTFSINNISYALNSNQGYVDANLSLSTSQNNLLDLLDLAESSGFSNSEFPYLVEVLGVNFSIPEQSVTTTEDPNALPDFNLDDLLNVSEINNLVYNVGLQLRIYQFNSSAI